MSVNANETIYAVATPPGRSAIAVIRISGAKASVAPSLFAAPCPEAGKFTISRLMQDSKVLDQVIIMFMEAPRSSTGEDVCEIHCHGSGAVIYAVLKLLAAAKGFRMANPGEFTQRSFMNGKIDLPGVEGLSDLIDAETPAQLHQAWAQIDGSLSTPVMEWRAKLVSIAAQLEALIDFSDEDLPKKVEQVLRKSTRALITDLTKNLNDGGVGEMVRDGVVVALVGPVNVGKSTILNALAGRGVAIVSDEAGTTRDIVQIQLNLHGVPVTILDTAGIRDTKQAIENEGIRRSIMAAARADLVIVVLDGSDKGWASACAKINDAIDAQRMGTATLKNKKFFVLNKSDRGIIKGTGHVSSKMMSMSAQNPDDIITLISVLEKQLVPLNYAEGSVIITRQRHRVAIQTAHEALSRALTYDFWREPELAAEDFRFAAAALGRITGEIGVDELLGSIFSAFCIGK